MRVRVYNVPRRQPEELASGELHATGGSMAWREAVAADDRRLGVLRPTTSASACRPPQVPTS